MTQKLLTLCLLLCVFAIQAVGCHSGTSSEPTTQPSEQTSSRSEATRQPAKATLAAPDGRREMVVFDTVDGYIQTPKNWNPLVPEREMDHGFHQAIIEPLFILNYETGEFVPWLGEAMTGNDRFDVWTLKLRQGITWSDGESFDADDVLFTMNLLLDNAPELDLSSKLDSWVATVEKIDDLTVQFNLKKPSPRFQLDVLASKIWGGISIVPEHIWRDKDPLTFKNYDPDKGWPIFTGPYLLESASTSQAVYQRDDNWWGAKSGWRALPKPKKLMWTTLTPVMGMANNKTDSLIRVSLKDLFELKKLNPNVITHFDELPYAWVPDPCSRSLDLNHTIEPWNDKTMRWALNYAIDRNEIVAFVLNDTTVPSRHFFPIYPSLERYDSLETAGLYDKYPLLQHNPAKSQALIESKGYLLNKEGIYEKDGQELTLVISSVENNELQAINDILVEQLQNVGIKATSKIGLAYAQWYHNLLVGNFEGLIGWWSCGSVKDPWASMNTFNTKWLTPIGEVTGEDQNIWRWSGEAADQYSDLVNQIGDLPLGDPQVDELFVEAMEIWFDELPIIPLTQASIVLPFNTTYWTGWPTAKNNYIQPPTWWQSAHLIIHNLEPVP